MKTAAKHAMLILKNTWPQSVMTWPVHLDRKKGVLFFLAHFLLGGQLQDARKWRKGSIFFVQEAIEFFRIVLQRTIKLDVSITRVIPSLWNRNSSDPTAAQRPEQWMLDLHDKAVFVGVEIALLMEEILHQLMCSSSHYLQGFWHPRWCKISEPSTVSLGTCAYFSLFFIFNQTFQQFRCQLGGGCESQTISFQPNWVMFQLNWSKLQKLSCPQSSWTQTPILSFISALSFILNKNFQPKSPKYKYGWWLKSG